MDRRGLIRVWDALPNVRPRFVGAVWIVESSIESITRWAVPIRDPSKNPVVRKGSSQ
jgi:hypothetical protein